jgi:hypothetical protein
MDPDGEGRMTGVRGDTHGQGLTWRVLTDKGSVYDLMHADALAYSGWE